MQTRQRDATPDELERLNWRPPERAGCFGLGVILGFMLFCAWATWLMGSITIEAWGDGELVTAVTGVVFTGIFAGMVGLFGISLKAQLSSSAPSLPRVTTWKIQPTAIGFALDSLDRDVVWCFAITLDGTFVIPSTALPWDEMDLPRRLGRAELQGESLYGLLSFTATGGSVRVVGATDLQTATDRTWTDGDLDIDLESPTWTRIERVPAWLLGDAASG